MASWSSNFWASLCYTVKIERSKLSQRLCLDCVICENVHTLTRIETLGMSVSMGPQADSRVTYFNSRGAERYLYPAESLAGHIKQVFSPIILLKIYPRLTKYKQCSILNLIKSISCVTFQAANTEQRGYLLASVRKHRDPLLHHVTLFFIRGNKKYSF